MWIQKLVSFAYTKRYVRNKMKITVYGKDENNKRIQQTFDMNEVLCQCTTKKFKSIKTTKIQYTKEEFNFHECEII